MESERTCLKGKERSSEITAINYNFFTTYLAVQNSSGRGKKKREDNQGYDNPARNLSHSTVNLNL